jgi:hypothetical protein
MSTTLSEALADSVPAEDQSLGNGTTGTTTEAAVAAAPGQETPSVDSQPPAAGKAAATTKAEEMVNSVAMQMAVATAYVGKGLMRLVARCREELSDIWAEAQNIRRGDKS